MPVPDSGMLIGELVALLLIETVPVTLPADVGEKPTVKEVDCPAARVNGSASPFIVKPVPVTPSWDKETLLFPVFVNVTLCEVLVPVATFPKVTDEGDADN